MSKPNYVFVLDTNRKPLTPCNPCLARKLLNAKKAKVFRLYPFTIILKKEVIDTPLPLTLKIDPGSRVTGLALLSSSILLWVAELTHRGLAIKASLELRRSLRRGHGSRQMCRTDKFGFPSRYVPRFKFVKGFQTGDIVKAVVNSGKKVGVHMGRVAVRSTGSFNISAKQGLIQGISHKYCQQIHQKDGYGYGF